jgi:tetratricopeptide (TPR) repeat protein
LPIGLALLLLQQQLSAQNANTIIIEGNELYKKAQFGEALKKYKSAQQKEPTNNAAQFNAGNAQYRSGKLTEAATAFEQVATTSTDKQQAAKAWYNRGVSLAKAQQLQPAIDAFKQAIKKNHTDVEARENLQKAINELKQQQQKKQQPNNNSQPPKDQQKNKNNNSKLSKDQAEQLLKTLNQEEKNLQQNLQKKKNQPTTKEKDW